ncbi:MAG TPA: 5-oxoprolinase subunit PxpA [Anaeromyxobacteraceae bacterium]|nr:5-oxoprolinase subunit PxpA [Anaeromyxobacteraceae bacterium]
MEVDLNCDMGESFGAWTLGCDEAAMPLVTSANVACGFHASDPGTMRRTVRLAKRHGVAVGAHPSFPDLVGFGRRALSASAEEIRDDVTYQVGALWAFCRAEGVPLRHVKPHGALYNLAAVDARVADAVAAAVRAVDPGLVLVCLSRSEQVEAARRAGQPFVEEAFADRAYTRAGTLVPRGQPGAVLEDPSEMAERVVRMVRQGTVAALDGGEVALSPGTVCVHGDTPGAVEAIRAIRARLAAEGIAVRPFPAAGAAG